MMYLNSNEEAIIGTFIDKESDYVGKSIKLSWNADNVTAIYDSFIEDENGCKRSSKMHRFSPESAHFFSYSVLPVID